MKKRGQNLLILIILLGGILASFFTAYFQENILLAPISVQLITDTGYPEVGVNLTAQYQGDGTGQFEIIWYRSLNGGQSFEEYSEFQQGSVLIKEENADFTYSNCVNPGNAYNDNWLDYSNINGVSGTTKACGIFQNYSWGARFNSLQQLKSELKFLSTSTNSKSFIDYFCYDYNIGDFVFLYKFKADNINIMTGLEYTLNTSFIYPGCISAENPVQLKVNLSIYGLGATIRFYEDRIWYNSDVSNSIYPLRNQTQVSKNLLSIGQVWKYSVRELNLDGSWSNFVDSNPVTIIDPTLQVNMPSFSNIPFAINQIPLQFTFVSDTYTQANCYERHSEGYNPELGMVLSNWNSIGTINNGQLYESLIDIPGKD